MRRLPPHSLVGQMAVLIGVALFLAQVAAFGYALVQRQQFTRAEIDVPAVTRFTSVAADYAAAEPGFRALVLTDASRRGAHYDLGGRSSISAEVQRRTDTESRLSQSLANAGIRVVEVRAAADASPSSRASSSRRHGGSMLLSAELPDKHWLNARLAIPAPPPLVTPELWVGTLLLYLFVLSATVLIATRLTRPLAKLTRAAEAFRGRNEPIAVEPSGPSDLRNAILAFNAMNMRLAGLLEEKDRTLGAIGHDLRTPLASLRIRAENVQPESERDRMIATIEEMTATLADILALARSGRAREPLQAIDVAALARSIADEFGALGHDVDVTGEGSATLEVQPNLLRRALRNLIDNAVTYGNDVSLDIEDHGERIIIRVLDRGPGVPPEELSRIAGAFYRLEPSRNRQTGGAGLGLSIAQAAAESHGGMLILANRAGGGFEARIDLVRQAPEQA